jgi:hypothetical protein
MVKKIGIYVWRTAVQKGAFGGNRTWMTVFAAMATVKVPCRAEARRELHHQPPHRNARLTPPARMKA